MAAMLAEFVETAPRAAYPGGFEPGMPTWQLLSNETNRGFVASVNRGIACYPDQDVVLLNSDTEVPPGWLQRLRGAAYRRPDIGTVTPFSNCGSLASYPVPNVENALPENLTLEQLDQFFQIANIGGAVDIPTGVGFCLYIRRDCLDDIGVFDEAAFGKGYGEENDFCLRALARGWTHVLAADCFVYHKGRGSFGEEKDARVRQAYALLVDRHPRYPALIQRHFADDPARPFRLRVDAMRLLHDVHGPRLVVVPAGSPSDSPGEFTGTAPVLQLSPIRGGYFSVHWHSKDEAFKLWFRLPDELDELCALLQALRVTVIQGDLQSVFPQAMASLTDIAHRGSETERATIGQAQLFDLLAVHGTPRFTGWLALQHMLAMHGLQLSESRLLQPLAGMLPLAVRRWLRQWIRSTKA